MIEAAQSVLGIMPGGEAAGIKSTPPEGEGFQVILMIAQAAVKGPASEKIVKEEQSEQKEQPKVQRPSKESWKEADGQDVLKEDPLPGPSLSPFLAEAQIAQQPKEPDGLIDLTDGLTYEALPSKSPQNTFQGADEESPQVEGFALEANQKPTTGLEAAKTALPENPEQYARENNSAAAAFTSDREQALAGTESRTFQANGAEETVNAVETQKTPQEAPRAKTKAAIVTEHLEQPDFQTISRQPSSLHHADNTPRSFEAEGTQEQVRQSAGLSQPLSPQSGQAQTNAMETDAGAKLTGRPFLQNLKEWETIPKDFEMASQPSLKQAQGELIQPERQGSGRVNGQAHEEPPHTLQNGGPQILGQNKRQENLSEPLPRPNGQTRDITQSEQVSVKVEADITAKPGSEANALKAQKPALDENGPRENLPKASFENALQANTGASGLKETGAAQPTGKAAEIPRDPQVAQQISAQVLEGVGKDQLSFKMKLKPEGLGQLTVEMKLENGRLSLQMLTDSVQAKESIAAQLDELKVALRASYIELSDVNVNTDSSLKQDKSNQFGSFGGNSNDPGARESFSGQNKAGYSQLKEAASFLPRYDFSKGVINYLV